MTSLFRPTPRRGTELICLTCRIRLRPLRRTQSAASRLFQPSYPARRTPAPLRSPLRPRTQAQRHMSKSPSYSTSTFATPPSTTGIAPLPHRRLLAVSGPDAAKFLQGLVTNNIDATRPASLYSAFLDARGRVLCDVFIWVRRQLEAETREWACWIEVDEGELAALKTHLRRHRLRSKVEIAEVDMDRVQVWAAWGAENEEWDAGAIVAALEDPRAPGLRRYLVRAGSGVEGVEALDAEAYRRQRYRCGVPEGPLEIPRESALPMEANFDLSRGIDFKKGCYVGQELTIRTKHTGVVRKRILPVSLQSASGAGVPDNGADIKALDENGEIKKGRPAGKFVAGIGDVGLALCRLENMTSMKVSAEGGSWKPGMEFGVEKDGRIVKARPMLYEWFVLRERELWDRERRRI